jgi:hypothetical protein
MNKVLGISKARPASTSDGALRPPICVRRERGAIWSCDRTHRRRGFCLKTAVQLA